MTITNYFDDDGWGVIDIGLEESFINTLYRSIICENGRCWIPPPTYFDEHILTIKRK